MPQTSESISIPHILDDKQDEFRQHQEKDPTDTLQPKSAEPPHPKFKGDIIIHNQLLYRFVDSTHTQLVLPTVYPTEVLKTSHGNPPDKGNV